jgi:hypothetical protein
MTVKAEISVERLNWRQWSSFAPTWERVHSSSPEASFFLSREWVDCWLATFGGEFNPDLLAFVRDGEVVGCCLLVRRTQWIRGVRLRRIYMNCAGEDDADSTSIEYNSLLSLPDCALEVAKTFQTFLQGEQWDELLLDGVAEHSSFSTALQSLGSSEVLPQPAHHVDFSRLRRDAADFDSALSPNTRQQIRRSLRGYERTGGPCILRVAQTSREATEMIARLADLHQVAWQNRGRRGAFSSSRFTAFHRRLVAAAFEQNRLLLLEVRSGAELIGVLYNFLYRGRVYFYQSGFRYDSDGRLKPGLVSHYLAIRHCLAQLAINEYDFMAGDSQYKRSLATASRPLAWIVVRRSTPATLLFRGLRFMGHKYVQLLNKNR